jgi:peptidyl-prolyl cis-trans isomerase NIMA-interacting 1
MIACCHILLKHSKSRSPFDKVRNKEVTRSLEEAQKIIDQIRAELENNLDKFQDYALKYSECSSAKNGGDLGPFSKGDMQESFENVAFALKKGELSQPVISDSGVHIILRYQ